MPRPARGISFQAPVHHLPVLPLVFDSAQLPETCTTHEPCGIDCRGEHLCDAFGFCKLCQILHQCCPDPMATVLRRYAKACDPRAFIAFGPERRPRQCCCPNRLPIVAQRDDGRRQTMAFGALCGILDCKARTRGPVVILPSPCEQVSDLRD